MAYVPLIVFGLLTLLLLFWVWLGSFSKDRLRESLFRNIGVPYRNLIGLLLGVVAALLLLSSHTWTIGVAAWVFVVTLAITMVLLVAVRPSVEKEIDRFAWGLLVIIVLGFGLGSLIYQTRSWWLWLWHQYLRINTPAEILLESLFLLGVLLGFFVVRNWAKEQKEFVASLTGLLSGAFVATIVGNIQNELTPMRSLAYYALGFTLSGTLNLIAAARLSAHYTNKRSISSRAMLDFLYGSERAKTIDGYFLVNFKEDLDYAKLRLTETVVAYGELVKREFAELMNRRARNRARASRDQSSRESLCARIREGKANEYNLRAELKELENEPGEAKAITEKKKELENVTSVIRELESQLIPCYFYELIAFECPKKESDSAASVQSLDTYYDVIYKAVGNSDDGVAVGSSITGEMFRVGVAIRWQDSLEYIVAPGQYRASFPYVGSVAGLSLMVRQTIIMNRDRMKQFRSKDYRDGICPRDTEQWRGLDEIDFLSYVSIPVVARLGSVSENAVGVVNLDTKIFVTPCKLDGKPLEGSDGMFRIELTPRQLTEYASNLYDQEDRDVEYLEKLTKLLVPVLELYLKCRIGAT
jgi:hypothetical protein